MSTPESVRGGTWEMQLTDIHGEGSELHVRSDHRDEWIAVIATPAPGELQIISSALGHTPAPQRISLFQLNEVSVAPPSGQTASQLLRSSRRQRLSAASDSWRITLPPLAERTLRCVYNELKPGGLLASCVEPDHV